MFFSEQKALIVVYKDEVLVNQLKKLVETKDDESDEDLIGTKDGTVSIIPWQEKVWLDNKKAGKIKNKVLFIGDIKETEKLIPVIDIKFDEFGVKYGWSGKQAAIFIDPKALAKKEDYEAFVEKLSALPVPEKIKEKVEASPVAAKVGLGIAAVLGFLPAIGASAVMISNEEFKNKAAIKQQMLFYGIMNMYFNHLEEFMNS